MEKCLGKNWKLIVFFLFLAFFIYLAWAVVIPTPDAPDEFARLKLSDYMFQNGTLPNGWDEAVRIPDWGFSYAFFPMLTSIVGAGFMKLFSIFTMDPHALLVAARLVSVICGTVTVLYCYKLARKLGLSEPYQWVFTCLIAFLPQFSFLSGYVNNDSFALMCVTMIVYYWAEGLETNWSYKSCIKLAIALSLCFLSYYNAYGFILSSAILFIASQLTRPVSKEKFGELLKKGFFIVGIVAVLAGWWFIRNALLYNGDFLGRETSSLCGELFGTGLKPSLRPSLRDQGYTIFQMLIPMNWILSVFKSFIGTFGYMRLYLREEIYWIMAALYGISGGALALGKASDIIKRRTLKSLDENMRKRRILIWCMLLSMVIVLGLSIWYSYTSDFQPQGRYLMPAASCFLLGITYGLRTVLNGLTRLFHGSTKVHVVGCGAVCLGMFALQMYTLFCVIFPTYL